MNLQTARIDPDPKRGAKALRENGFAQLKNIHYVNLLRGKAEFFSTKFSVSGLLRVIILIVIIAAGACTAGEPFEPGDRRDPRRLACRHVAVSVNGAQLPDSLLPSVCA